jgi:hypothetical protein
MTNRVASTFQVAPIALLTPELIVGDDEYDVVSKPSGRADIIAQLANSHSMHLPTPAAMSGLPDVLKISDGQEKLSLPPNNLPVSSLKCELTLHFDSSSSRAWTPLAERWRGPREVAEVASPKLG